MAAWRQGRQGRAEVQGLGRTAPWLVRGRIGREVGRARPRPLCFPWSICLPRRGSCQQEEAFLAVKGEDGGPTMQYGHTPTYTDSQEAA